MSLSPQERAARRDAFRKMDTAGKAEYLFEYYKLPIILALIALALLCSTLYRQLTKKDVLLYSAYINVSVGDSLDEKLGPGFVAAFGADPRKAEVYTYRGLYLSDHPAVEDHEYGYASRLKLMAAVESDRIDVVFMNRESYDLLSQSGYLLELPDILPDTLHFLIEPYLTENTVILEDNAIEYELNEADQYQAVTKGSVNGLDVSTFPMFQKAGFSAPVYFGVIANSPHREAVVRYIEYLAAG